MNINKVYYLILIFGFAFQTSFAQNNYDVVKTDKEWRSQLNELSYLVLRKAYTERPYTGKYDDFYEKGTYHCAGCDEPLYKSDHKYNSFCGWPSFDREISDKIEYDVDYKLGYPRTEIKCKKCGGHLGHVFNDGPKETTGKRHCVNSVALVFKKRMTKKENNYWSKKLDKFSYKILRESGTEMPFSGKYNMHFEDGSYKCKGCGNSLFESNSKFDSGCGWPSFDQSIKGSIIYKEDNSLDRTRTEIICSKCEGHLGHVFNDGPTETGMRYCVNSASLNFKK